MLWDLLSVNRRGLINAPAELSTVSTPLKSKHLCSCFVCNRLVFLFSWKTHKWGFILRWQREVWVMGSSELLHNLRLSPPEGNPPFPTSVPPNMQGCGNSWRKKEEGWWDRNSATLPAREWLRHFVGSHPCTFPAMRPKIFPPWLPKNSPCLPPSTNAALQRIWLRSREAKRFFFFSEICFRL